MPLRGTAGEGKKRSEAKLEFQNAGFGEKGKRWSDAYLQRPARKVMEREREGENGIVEQAWRRMDVSLVMGPFPSLPVRVGRSISSLGSIII